MSSKRSSKESPSPTRKSERIEKKTSQKGQQHEHSEDSGHNRALPDKTKALKDKPKRQNVAQKGKGDDNTVPDKTKALKDNPKRQNVAQKGKGDDNTESTLKETPKLQNVAQKGKDPDDTESETSQTKKQSSKKKKREWKVEQMTSTWAMMTTCNKSGRRFLTKATPRSRRGLTLAPRRKLVTFQ
jgi:hypothetical protein